MSFHLDPLMGRSKLWKWIPLRTFAQPHSGLRISTLAMFGVRGPKTGPTAINHGWVQNMELAMFTYVSWFALHSSHNKIPFWKGHCCQKYWISWARLQNWLMILCICSSVKSHHLAWAIYTRTGRKLHWRSKLFGSKQLQTWFGRMKSHGFKSIPKYFLFVVNYECIPDYWKWFLVLLVSLSPLSFVCSLPRNCWFPTQSSKWTSPYALCCNQAGSAPWQWPNTQWPNSDCGSKQKTHSDDIQPTITVWSTNWSMNWQVLFSKCN